MYRKTDFYITRLLKCICIYFLIKCIGTPPIVCHHFYKRLGRVAQSVGHLTRKSGVLGSIPSLATSVSPSTFSRRAVVSYWQKYMQEVLVNRLGGLSLPRKSVVRLNDHPDMTLDVYRGCETTMQQQQQQLQGETTLMFFCLPFWTTYCSSPKIEFL